VIAGVAVPFLPSSYTPTRTALGSLWFPPSPPMLAVPGSRAESVAVTPLFFPPVSFVSAVSAVVPFSGFFSPFSLVFFGKSQRLCSLFFSPLLPPVCNAGARLFPVLRCRGEGKYSIERPFFLPPSFARRDRSSFFFSTFFLKS